MHNTQRKMANKTGIILLIAIILAINVAFAKTSIDTRALVVNNNTWRSQVFAQYDAESNNNVRAGEKLNVFVQYSCSDYGSVAEFNANYPNHNIQNVTLNIIYSPYSSLTNGSSVAENQIVEQINLDELNMPFSNFKKFYNLQDKETILAYIDTNYVTPTALARDSLCRVDLVLGTEGCNRCKELDYYTFEQDISEADTIKGYSANIYTKIKNLFLLNYEFFIIIYYLILIALVLAVVSAIFYVILYAYHWIQHWSKK